MADRVYLAGPIHGKTDAECNDWRLAAERALNCPTTNPVRWDMRGRERGNESAIVEGDKRWIDSCTILLALCTEPTTGTAMEILYAWERGKTVYIICPDPNPSPWLTYHAHDVFRTVGDAIVAINSSSNNGRRYV